MSLDCHREEPHGRACPERPCLISGPTDLRSSTPSAAWGSSSTSRGRRRRRLHGCRRARSTTSSGRTSWWTCTSRCGRQARAPLPPQPHPQSMWSPCRLPGAHATPCPRPWGPTAHGKLSSWRPEICAPRHAHPHAGAQQTFNKCANNVPSHLTPRRTCINSISLKDAFITEAPFLDVFLNMM